MALIVVAGPDAALLEGLSQTLVAAGHRVVVSDDVAGALDALQGAKPLVALIHREELVRGGTAFRISLAQGGALLAYHGDDIEEEFLPFSLRRATLAELRLPLERQRLLALIRHVESRWQTTGRDSTDGDTSLESHSS